MDCIQFLRNPPLHGEWIHQQLYRCLLRNHVGIYDNGSYNIRRCRMFPPRTALLAFAHPMDRRSGNRVLHHRPAAIACRRTDQGVCCRGYRSYQDQASSPSFHFGKMDMEYLSDAHHRLHHILLCGGNESLRQFQLCDEHDGNGWFRYPQQQYRVLPFTSAGIHLYVLLFPVGCELHPALCSRHQV